MIHHSCWITALVALSGCATANVKITKADGTIIEASGISFAKDHGLEGMTYERSATSTTKGAGLVSPASTVTDDSAKFGLAGYSSTAKIEAILRLLEELK